MKKTAYTTLLLLVVIASACGGAPSSANPSSGSPGDPAVGELPAATQLILGTLKLDDTDQAVSAEQAAELLPLWQTMQVLSESDTAAQQEKDALVEQIQETMTAEQMQAITDMSLSRADMMTVMQEQGLAMGAGPTGSQSSNTQSGNSSNNSGRNFGPGGGMPLPDERGFSGGPGFGSGQGQNLSADQIATAQAARQAGDNLVPAPLLNAVVEYLQKKAAA